jgi:hypothetical protein
MLLLSGCGEDGTIDSPRSPDQGVWPPAGDLGSFYNEDGQAPPPQQWDTGAPPAADSQQVVPPGCPDPGQLAGSYAGSYTGTIQVLIPITLNGTLEFTVVPGGGGEMTLQNGKVKGTLLGITYEIPMNGTVKCGSLNGQGSGDISGVQFSGQYLATWSANNLSFTNGSWSGQDAATGTKGSGTWSASKQ